MTAADNRAAAKWAVDGVVVRRARLRISRRRNAGRWGDTSSVIAPSSPATQSHRLWEECVAIFERGLVTGRDDLAATLTWSARYQVQHVADDIIAVLCGLDSSVTRRQYSRDKDQTSEPFLVSTSGKRRHKNHKKHKAHTRHTLVHLHTASSAENLDTYAQLVAGCGRGSARKRNRQGHTHVSCQCVAEIFVRKL